ncbi:sodium- and chloride-dependent creatine transporter 1-like [Pecten maximus]|uniref:sodium- and chloride-dependent creatine transporter 1-like n=1 Tax=Pecten maximus TaxID=6579 RepID=UPI001458283E|nr:sodium- and chloride-dependent creatine transporter 1-like [Pecten maximus]
MSAVSYNEDNSRMYAEKREMSKKEQWSRKLDYTLTILGCLVGFGNVWRFPYICMKNGGGAFLLPYVLILFLMVIPVYFLEATLGQFTGKAIRDVWNYCPLIKGMGFGIQVMLIPTVCYYVMLMTWVMNYMYHTFQNPLPWSTCGNEWNTPYCFSAMDNARPQLIANVSNWNASSRNITHHDLHNYSANYEGNTSSTSNITSSLTNLTYRETKGHSAEEEFWQYKILGISSGLEDVGSLKLNLVLSLILAWVIVYLCIIKGIKSSGKVVYVTATLPYILLFVLLVHNLTLPGSMDGVVFFIKPDFETLLNIQVWIQAAIQIFYSLGIGWGIHITLSRYNKFNNNCLRDTFMVAIASEVTSVFAGFVIFSAFGFMAHQAKVPLTEVVKSGPGLGFVAYPMALAQMPIPNLWAVLFFIAMLTLGVDGQFVLTEITFVYFEDCFPFLVKKQVLFRACLTMIGIVMSLPFCTQCVAVFADGDVDGDVVYAAIVAIGVDDNGDIVYAFVVVVNSGGVGTDVVC